MLLATAVALASLAGFTGTAGAVGTRSSQVKVSCNFGGRSNAPTATAGTSYSCAVNVGDTGSGTTIRPTGTASVVLSGTAGATAVNTCTVAPVSSNNWDTTCTIYVAVFAAGTLNVSASYSGDNTFNVSSAAAKDQITNVAVNAGANLAVLATAPGTTGTNTPGTLSLGDAFTVYGANCSVTSGTAQGYVLVGNGVDPNTTTTFIVGPLTVGANKSYSLPVSIDSSQSSGTFVARYVCAKGAVTSNTDADIVFTSNTYTTTVTAGAAMLRSTSNLADGTVVRSARVADPDSSSGLPLTATLSFNTDSANSVDRFGIFKESSDILKARTDSLLAASGTVSRIGFLLVDGGLDRATTERLTSAVSSRTSAPADVASAALSLPNRSAFAKGSDAEFVAGLYLRGLGREATTSERDNATNLLRTGATSRAALVAAVAGSAESVQLWKDRSYVVAAYQATTASMPTQGDLDGAVARLRSGTLRVNVVEDIALTAAPASEWNAAVPAGKMPAAATFAAPAAPRPPVAAPAPAPAAKAPAAKAPAKRRTAVRRTVRKAPAHRVATRRATVRKAPASTSPSRTTSRKVVAQRTATVRR